VKIDDSSEILAVVDDDRAIQIALQDLIESQGMSALCFDSAEQFLDYEPRNQASCLIADIGMPGMSGIELQARLRAEHSEIPIIFLTARGDIALAVTAMKDGASNFLAKPFRIGAFMTAVERALEENRIARRKARERGDLLARYYSLTPREREVLTLVVSGLLNKQAAVQLGITEYTVQVHRGHIMRKMRADSFAALVRMAEGLNSYIRYRRFESPQEPACIKPR
jgi:FixJ family two-component response regulator